jgi:hypothetical protein
MEKQALTASDKKLIELLKAKKNADLLKYWIDIKKANPALIF